MSVQIGTGYFVRTLTRGTSSLRITVDVPTADVYADRVEAEILAPTEAEALGALRRWRGTLAAYDIRRDSRVEAFSSDPAPFRCCQGLTWGLRCPRCHGRPQRRWTLLRVEG